MKEDGFKLGRLHDTRMVRTKPLENRYTLELSRRRPLERVTFAVVSLSTTLEILEKFCSVSLKLSCDSGPSFFSTCPRWPYPPWLHDHAGSSIPVVLLCDMRDA